jgi:hypothetical protein
LPEGQSVSVEQGIEVIIVVAALFKLIQILIIIAKIKTMINTTVIIINPVNKLLLFWAIFLIVLNFI